MMTSAQRRLFLGALCEGLSTESALEEADATPTGLMAACDADPLFVCAYQFAEACRREYLAASERLLDG